MQTVESTTYPKLTFVPSASVEIGVGQTSDGTIRPIMSEFPTAIREGFVDYCAHLVALLPTDDTIGRGILRSLWENFGSRELSGRELLNEVRMLSANNDSLTCNILQSLLNTAYQREDGVDWTDKIIYKGVIDAVEAVGKRRLITQGGTMSDADFFAGALAAMQALGLTPDKWPSSWTLGLMFGRKSPLRDLPTLVPGTPILPKDGTKKDAVRAWVLALPDGEHGGRHFDVDRLLRALAEQGITLSKSAAYRYLDDMCDEGLLHKSAGGAAYWWRVVGEKPAEQPAATRQDKIEKIRHFVANWPANKMFTTSRVEGELWQYNLPRGLVTKTLRQMEKEDLVRQVSSTGGRIRWVRVITEVAQAAS